ncbi:MAG: TolC family protein [Bacteroidota bacterium]
MKYTANSLIILWVVLLSHFTLMAQTPLSLEQCIQQAWQQSRTALKAQLGIERAELQIAREKASTLPLLQADAQNGYQFGRNIDPTTNAFNNDAILFNSVTINGSWLLYQGGRATYAKAHRQELLIAANAQEAQVKFQLQLEVTNAFLNVLMAKEYVQQITTASLASQEQLKRIEQDIALGVRPEKEKVQLETQLAAENRNLLNASAQLEEASRSLKQLLRLPITQSINIQTPSNLEWQVSFSDQQPDIKPQEALAAYPAYQVAISQWRASGVAQKIIKAERYPSIRIFGQLNTRFSSAAQALADVQAIPLEQEVLVAGEPSTLTFMQQVPVYEKSPFFQQWQDNFGQAVGLQIAIPIFDQSANRLAREEASITRMEAQIRIEAEQDWFFYELDRLQSRLTAAQQTYQAAQHSAALAQQVYEMANGAYRIGASSSYELLEAKKQLNNEQARLLQAKYDCLFARKILSSFADRPQ